MRFSYLILSADGSVIGKCLARDRNRALAFARSQFGPTVTVRADR